MSKRNRSQGKRSGGLSFVAILLAAAALAAIAFSVAWLVSSVSSKCKVLITDMNTTCFACFVKSDREDNTVTFDEFNTALSNDGNAFVSGELLSVNLTDENADNYIGNLRVVAKYTGASPAYVRVRAIEQWMRNKEYIASDFVGFTNGSPDGNLGFSDGDGIDVVPSYQTDLTGEWYDNRSEDFSYYYTAPVYPGILQDKDYNQIMIFVINGVTPDALSKLGNLGSGQTLDILFMTEMVQPNRYREFWDISSLPWENCE